jgi:hypothetical protein
MLFNSRFIGHCPSFKKHGIMAAPTSYFSNFSSLRVANSGFVVISYGVMWNLVRTTEKS